MGLQCLMPNWNNMTNAVISPEYHGNSLHDRTHVKLEATFIRILQTLR